MPDTDVGSSSSSSVGSFIPVQFPPCFSGDGTSDFMQWCRRFEVAVDACPNAASVDLAKTLGSRLTGSAFTVWDALSPEIKKDYKTTKTELGKVFSKRDEVISFQRMINARPRQPGEPLVVYKCELERLTRHAFPLLDNNAREDELFRRFVAGLSPDMRAKCHEHGADNIGKAMEIAQQVERASDSHGSLAPFSAQTPQVAVVTNTQNDPLDQILQRLNSLQMSVDTLQTQYNTLRGTQDHASRPRSRFSSEYSDYLRQPSRSRDRYDRRQSPTPYRTEHGQPSGQPSRGRSPSPYPPRRHNYDRGTDYRSSGYSLSSRSPSRRDQSPFRDGRRDGDQYRYRSKSPSARSNSFPTSSASPARVSFQGNQY